MYLSSTFPNTVTQTHTHTHTHTHTYPHNTHTHTDTHNKDTQHTYAHTQQTQTTYTNTTQHIHITHKLTTMGKTSQHQKPRFGIISKRGVL